MNDYIRTFLQDHPEHRDGIRYTPSGPQMSTEAVEAFAAWALKNGYTTADKIALLKRKMAQSLASKNN